MSIISTTYSCISDKCNHLCHECDGVFHKSAAKRSHIRVPVLSSGFENDFRFDTVPSVSHRTPISRYHALQKASNFLNEALTPSIRFVLLDADVITTRQKHIDGSDKQQSVQQQANVPINRLLLSDGLTCHLLAAVRGLVDDRKVLM